MITVREVMHANVISVLPNALVEQALDLMIKHRISGLPVIDENGILVGLISEFDALELMCDSKEDYWPVEPVAGLMTTKVESVDVNLRLSDLAQVFRNRSVRRLPVIEHGKVVGIVSRRDVIKAIRAERKRLANLTLLPTYNLTDGTANFS